MEAFYLQWYTSISLLFYLPEKWKRERKRTTFIKYNWRNIWELKKDYIDLLKKFYAIKISYIKKYSFWNSLHISWDVFEMERLISLMSKSNFEFKLNLL